jgi:hypothetical protein
MSISSNIEFFTQDVPAATPPGIGILMTMFANAEGLTGIGTIVSFDADASEVYLLRGPQISEGTLAEDRLVRTTAYVLDTTASIDLTSTGTTTIYTAPSTKTALIFGVILQVTTADTVTVVPDASIGLNPSTDNVFAVETLTSLDAVDELYHFWANIHKAVAISNGGVLDLDVDTAATATTLTATARVIGIVLD